MTSTNKTTAIDLSLVIQARPQVSVSLNDRDELEISTARIADDFERVAIDLVVIPLADARQVANAMLALLESRIARTNAG